MQTNSEQPELPAGDSNLGTEKPKAVVCKELLESLAETFDRRVGELQKWSKQWAEDPATIRAMELVYADISRALRAECEKLSNEKSDRPEAAKYE